MSLPKKLKNLDLFVDGQSYVGQILSVTLPTLSRNMEEYRGGGMSGPVKIDMGQQAIDLEWKCGGFMREVCRQYGITTVAGLMLRFVGAYQNDQTGAYDQVEVVVRGRHEEIGAGDAKAGDDTEFSVKTACAYYKLSVNGQTDIEIDFVNMIETVGGVDRLAEQREVLGRGGSSVSGLVSGATAGLPRIPGLSDLF